MQKEKNIKNKIKIINLIKKNIKIINLIKKNIKIVNLIKKNIKIVNDKLLYTLKLYFIIL